MIAAGLLFTGLGNNVSDYLFTYVDIPNRPALGTSQILTYSAPGNILNSTGGTSQDKILSGAWEQFHAFSFVGTDVAHQRISNEDGSTVIGSITNHLFTREGTGTTYFEINGKSAAEPLYFEDVGSVAATSALQISAFSTGPYVWIGNIVNNSRGYAVFANSAGTLSGGDASTPVTSSNNYQDFVVKFVRSFSPVGNKEHFYIGATTTTTYAIHHNFSIEHCFGYESEWDGMQIENATDFYANKLTIINGGTDDTASQNANIQVQNAYGTVENCIFMGAPQGFRFTSQEILFDNNYVHWTGNIGNEILDYYGNYAASNRLMVDPTGKEITISNCDFVADTWAGALLTVYDPEVNITVSNCRIAGATSLFGDSRGGGPTGTLTDGGGNTFVSASEIPTPTFSNYTPTDFTGHGLLTEEYHHALGRGYRTPNAA